MVVLVCKPTRWISSACSSETWIKWVSLLLSLSGRLLRVESTLDTLDPDTEHHERLPLLEKKRQLPASAVGGSGPEGPRGPQRAGRQPGARPLPDPRAAPRLQSLCEDEGGAAAGALTAFITPEDDDDEMVDIAGATLDFSATEDDPPLGS
ncbi:hypothetical protein KUCAC02_035334, partial [Chaenocephalus aceratus]